MAVNPTVSITHPALLCAHQQKENAYLVTKDLIDQEQTELKACLSEIETFSKDVRAKGKAYQEATDPGESTTALLKEQKDFLAHYEKFKSTYEKTNLVIENIKQTIAFLTPVAKQWSQEKTSESNAPELYAQSKESERICLELINTLNQHQVELTDSKERLYALINHPTLTWSLQRFCCIVDNGGNPISAGWRLVNYVAPYVVTPTFPKSSEIIVPEAKEPQKEDDLLEL